MLTRGPSYGKVTVFLGKQKLRTLGATGAPRTQALAGIKRFAAPTSGKVRIVSAGRKPVRIEGLGVRTSDAGPTRTSHVRPMSGSADL